MNAGRNAAFGTKTKRFSRSATMLAAVVVSGILAGCSTDTIGAPQPVAPEQGPKAGLLGSVLTLVTAPLQNVLGLLRLTPQPELVRAITVDAAGGVLNIPETGLRLTIPRGAVSARTTITVKSIAGRTVAYDFEPHGIKFAVPLEFSQDLAGTTVKEGTPLSGGYFASTTQLLSWLGLAKVNEVVPARVIDGRAVFGISHFSGYMVSTGKAPASAESEF